ncbi:hypothetical protein [Blastopirellula marina]|uniref:Verru_Chthon cassette protein A n=1 Tax=Blastopirellula marina DSM 3645 TaxID=314230 RepID=A3ZTU4_9BACT|nr:hypothetical protein [Blastopirellula marina]EAQ79999.1 hypothetical protein DSM3645_05235 [Blastopirellula marina DSM 3645]
MNRKHTPRRGAILLVVLSVLVLFALVGVTFVVTAGQFNRAATAGRNNPVVADMPQQDADSVMLDLVRDVRIGSNSDLKAHALLTDMYGRSIRGEIIASNTKVGMNGYAANSGQQLIVTNFRLASLNNPTDSTTTVNDTATAGYSYFNKDYYSGNVLTFISGANKGKSTRILSYDPGLVAGGSGTISDSTQRALVFDAITDGVEKLSAPAVGDEFVINDKPFDGTGFGYRPVTGPAASQLDLTETITIGSISIDMPVALAPRFNRYAPSGMVGSYLVTQGGADESYDAPDLQNMALSYIPTGTIPVNPNDIIPSFHRPSLAKYWFDQIVNNTADFPTFTDTSIVMAEDRIKVFRQPYGPDWQLGTTDDPAGFAGDEAKLDELRMIAAIRRRIIFRPEFANESPVFRDFREASETTGPFYDVDNDRDGVAESIWIDPGLPVKTGPHGRRYKALAAIYVRDMDGLLNMNAHGGYAHFDQSTSPPVANVADLLSDHNAYNASGGTIQLPIGQGYGPADVNLRDFFANTNEYLSILTARYGSNTASDVMPGQMNVNDPLSRLGSIGRPGNIFTNRATGAYGEPADYQGRSRMYIDQNGQPRWVTVDIDGSQDFSTMNDNQVVDDPYEYNLIRSNANDSKFEPSELEQLLREGDVDANYLASDTSNRLRSASTTFDSVQHRRSVTTESTHVPALPRAPVPDDLRTELNSFTTILDLARVRCIKEMVDNGVAQETAKQEVDDILELILPFEIRHGEPFDLNRLLETPNDFTTPGGNLTPVNASRRSLVLGTAAPFNAAPYDAIRPGASSDSVGNYLNGDPILSAAIGSSEQHRASRQLYARHLFCLMMLLTFEHDSAVTTNIRMRYKLPNFTPNHTGLALTDEQQRELTVRRIAQWAINVVDFRDKDGIMTPFEYDATPFNGWRVDGDIGTNELTTIVPPFTAVNPDRRVVWGCESPDLVMTESKAFHDRRAMDTAYDAGMHKRDDPSTEDMTLDQHRMPQGSLFLELFCPRNANVNNKSFPLELYSVNDNGTTGDLTDDYYQLDLNRTSPADGSGLNHPVWRIVVAKPTDADKVDGDMTPRQLANVADPRYSAPAATRNIEGVHFQPKEMVPDGSGGFRPLNTDEDPGFYGPIGGTSALPPDDLQIERIVWLANIADPTGFPDYELTQGAIYTNTHAANTKLTPGRYAVVGPRLSTIVSSKPDPAKLDGTDHTGNLPGDQIFSFTAPAAGAPSVFSTAMAANEPYPASDIQQNMGIICQALEPRTGDIKPALATLTGTGGVEWNGTAQLIGMSVSEPFPRPTDPTVDGYYPKPTITLDNFTAVDGYTDMGNSPAGGTFALPKDLDIDTYLGDAVEEVTGAADLSDQTITDFRTALVQRLADPTLPHDKTTNPYITIDWKTIDLTIYNGEDDPTGSMKAPAEFDPSAPSDPSMADIRFFARERGAGTGVGDAGDLWRSGNREGSAFASNNVMAATSALAAPATDAYFDYPSTNTLGYVNAQFGDPRPAGGLARFVGSPYDSSNPTDTSRTFSWLQWANRPLISKYELMLVPTSAPQRLLFEYDLARNTQSDGSTATEPYGANGDSADALMAPYPYLFNFFHSKKTESVLAGTAAATEQSAQFARIFDFVDVPSPFVDTKSWYNPSTFAAAGWADGYRPPFNRRLRYREPGRINLNTVPSKLVYDAMFDEDLWKNGLDNNFPDFDKIRESRRGATSSNGLPTRFANPFRSASSAELAPLDSMKSRPVEGTALRSDGVISPAASLTESPLFDLTVANAALATSKNPMFTYMPYHRLGNLTTTQSNVYAVWITLGYFEVEPTTISSVHPDGWQLGQELGSDTGEITRNRSFYLIDRSIPVGYEPGEDYNVEDAVLLKRRID